MKLIKDPCVQNPGPSPSPPAYITLDRSDGVQTTAPPSLPTQLEGLGSQLHDLHRWCTLYHSAATLHAA